MLDSKLEPEEYEEIPEDMTEEEFQATIEEGEIDRQIEKYNL